MMDILSSKCYFGANSAYTDEAALEECVTVHVSIRGRW